MAEATIDASVDDHDGSEGVETVRIGLNGDWRELDLSKKNLAALSKAIDRYWNVSRPVSANGRSGRRCRPKTTSPWRPAGPRPATRRRSGVGVYGGPDRSPRRAVTSPATLLPRNNEANGESRS